MTTGMMNLWEDEVVGWWASEAQGCVVVAVRVDGLSEVEHQPGFSWGVVVVDEEDIHHVSLPMTAMWTMVLVSDSTMSTVTSNFWMNVTIYTASDLWEKQGGNA